MSAGSLEPTTLLIAWAGVGPFISEAPPPGGTTRRRSASEVFRLPVPSCLRELAASSDFATLLVTVQYAYQT